MAEFPRVGFFSKGYDCGQVDAFFEDARRAYEGLSLIHIPSPRDSQYHRVFRLLL